MRQFYLEFEKCQTLFDKLSWRYYAENDLENSLTRIAY